MRPILLPTVPLAVLLGFALSGCSPPKPEVDETELNLRRIAQAYVLVISARGRPPKDVEQLKQQFKELGESRDPDTILRSPRDGQPFVIAFAVPLNEVSRNLVLAYEREGKDGKRYVLMAGHDIKELTDEEFAAADFVPGYRPDQPR
jgi:hypothetical protein